ncbi:hypothetical protein C0W35_09755 [Photobacterium kishitanii]|uniref:reverse transcriptase domain-containing protein n=1 Tax=Photobacterium kishitanii TaxID=318456 RepID=UPI000D1761CE|nr:reverse transcriptase domain-containing protein [Photobacterium kishitanii]PSU93978.1 hypothetical protein C0W35_09755 [Photobacterium kishitanii]
MNIKDIQQKWKAQFLGENGKRRANYLHFDVKLSLDEASKKIFNPHYIMRHSFWPFISYELKTKKIKSIYKYISEKNIEYRNDTISYSNSDIKNIIDNDSNVDRLLLSKKGRPDKVVIYKVRPICYASHIDSLIYSYYGEIINYGYEKILIKKELTKNVLAFRKQGNEKKCNIHYSLQSFNDIKALDNSVVLAFDVKNFFNILDHDILKKKWLEVIQQFLKVDELPKDHYKVFKSLTKYTYIDRDVVYDFFGISKLNSKNISNSIKNKVKNKTLDPLLVYVENKNKRVRICKPEAFRCSASKLINKNKGISKGIPQGTSISALLSNIYLIDFDVKIKNFIEGLGGSYYRYCDDLLCILPLYCTNDIYKQSDLLEKFMYQVSQEFKLDINKEKTEKYVFLDKDNSYLTSIKKLCCYKIKDNKILPSKLQYLGFKFDGDVVTVRSSTILRYQRKMKRGIKYQLRIKAKYGSGVRLNIKKIRMMYSHSGVNNFAKYVYRSSYIMSDERIKKQIKNHQKDINKQIKIISKRININDSI